MVLKYVIKVNFHAKKKLSFRPVVPAIVHSISYAVVLTNKIYHFKS